MKTKILKWTEAAKWEQKVSLSLALKIAIFFGLRKRPAPKFNYEVVCVFDWQSLKYTPRRGEIILIPRKETHDLMMLLDYGITTIRLATITPVEHLEPFVGEVAIIGQTFSEFSQNPYTHHGPAER